MSSIVTRRFQIDEWIPTTLSIWHKAWDDPSEMSCESICAKIACVAFPIILAIGCGECIVHACMRVWKICHPENRPFEPVITVELRGARQYDFPENRPSACAFHALSAIASIGTIFDIYAKEIEDQAVDKLSQKQRAIIKNGLKMYRIALKKDPSIREGADHEHVRNSLPATVKRCADFGPTNEDTDPVETRVEHIAEELFSDAAEKRAAWIKNGNEEFFSVIVYNGRAIIFDSHKNAMTLIYGQEETEAFLIDKLTPYSNMLDGFDASPFSYAIGTLEISSSS